MMDTETCSECGSTRPSLDEIKRKGWILVLAMIGVAMGDVAGTQFAMATLLVLYVAVILYERYFEEGDSR